MSQKTPISLMNELCKSNNFVPEYEVIEETGPPHDKTFTVSLKISNIGSYEGIAKTIKAAKHKAADLGLATSGLTKPARKPKSIDLQPSVILNALAARLGKTVLYQDTPCGINHTGPNPVPSNAYGQYNNQFKQYYPGYYRNSPTNWTVSVKVGEKEYIGEGTSRKRARHHAAQNALDDLQAEGTVDTTAMESNAEGTTASARQEMAAMVQNVENPLEEGKIYKSDISQVYEIASHQKMKIDFEVVSSTGPPHNRLFVTTVKVGELTATGEGASKKASKYQASVKILPDLISLPSLPVPAKAKGWLYHYGGYSKKSTKELDPSLNPISLLGQLRQRRKESLPVYTLVGEEGVRNKEFTIQIELDSLSAQGTGANKKEAKKNAAEAMLQLLGVRNNKSGETSQESAAETQEQKADENYKEASREKAQSGDGRQLPPGLLPILPEMTNRTNMPPQRKPLVNHTQAVSYPPSGDGLQSKQSGPTITVLNRAPGAPVGKPISDEQILQNGSTPSMKKLEQLAKIQGFQVNYQDSTQPEKEERLAVVTVSTVPQLICRGFGSTIEQAFENAAANALLPLLQPPTGNGQVANGQRNINVVQDDSPHEAGKP